MGVILKWQGRQHIVFTIGAILAIVELINCSKLFVGYICCRYAIPDNSYSIPANVGVDELNKLVNSQLSSGNVFCNVCFTSLLTFGLGLNFWHFH